jgi:AcrR family transcriptional regulator
MPTGNVAGGHPPPTTRDRTALLASRRVVDLLVANGSSDFTVRELAAHAEISERSFYRYFPRKEDVVRPFLSAGAELIARLVRERPADEPLRDALVAAWAASWQAREPAQATTLRRILHESDSLRATWLQVLADAERVYAGAIAERLGIDVDSRRAAVAGAAVATAIRLSTGSFTDESGCDDDQISGFAANLDLFGPELFRAPHEPQSP